MKILFRLLSVLFMLSTVVSFAKGKKVKTQILFAPMVDTGRKPTTLLRMFSTELDTTTKDSMRMFTCVWDTTAKAFVKVDSIAPFTIKYYAKAPDSLIFHSTLKNTYLKTIDLSKIARRDKNKLHVNFPLNFESCYIGKLICDTTIDTIYFNADVSFSSCTIGDIILPTCIFRKSFEMERPVVYNSISFEGSEFDSTFILRVSFKDWFSNQLTKKGQDSLAELFFMNGYDIQPLNFKNCSFRGSTRIFNVLKYHKLSFSSSHFFKDVSFLRSYGKKKRIEDNDDIKNDQFGLCGIDLSNTTFNAMASFYREPVLNVNFKSAYFKGVLNLFETTFTDSNSKALSQARFAENAVCILRPDNFSFFNLKFNWVTVDRLNFPFVNDTGGIIGVHDSLVHNQETIENIEKYYGSLKEQAKGYYNKQDEVYERLQQKYEHQKLQYEMAHDLHNGHLGSYLAAAIPELFVRNGFDGEGRFFLLTILSVLFFAFLYFFFCKREMVKYFNEGDDSLNTDDPRDPANTMRARVNNISFKTYFKGLWLSTIVLISPHFPKKYFKIKGIMFAFVLIEWGLGLLMIILFFLHIAGHYPIVKTLIGI